MKNLVVLAMLMGANSAVAMGICGSETKKVVEKALKSTVEIQACGEVTAPPPRLHLHKMSEQSQNPPQDTDKIFRDFFRKKGLGRGVRPQKPQKRCSKGTGIVYDVSQKLVLTNAHVAAALGGNEELQVRIDDGRVFKAKLLGYSKEKDLAMLKLQTEKDLSQQLVDVEFESMSEVYQGQIAFALGQPQGLSETLTSLVVSSYHRAIPIKSTGQVARFLQLNGDIFSGNSGGPAFSCHGKLIGINTAILPGKLGRGVTHVGVGLAVPADTVQRIAPKLSQGEGVFKGNAKLGIEVLTQKASEERAAYLLVGNVLPQSAAEAIGIKKGDIVLSIADVDLEAGGILPERLAGLFITIVKEFDVGDHISMVVEREGEVVELEGEVLPAPISNLRP